MKDWSGISYTITTNTINNESLRYRDIGLSRKVGARHAGNIGFAFYDAAQVTLSHGSKNRLFSQGGYTFSKTIDNVSGAL